MDRSKKTYTPDELTFIEMNAHHRSFQQIAEYLGRTWYGVYYAYKFLVNGRRAFNGAELARELGISKPRLYHWIRTGHFGWPRYFRQSPGPHLSKRRMRKIEHMDAIAFVTDPWYFSLYRPPHGDTELIQVARQARERLGCLYVGARYLGPRCFVTHSAVAGWCSAGQLPAGCAPVWGGQGYTYIVPRIVADAWCEQYVGGLKPSECAPIIHQIAREANGFDDRYRAPWRSAWRWD